FFGRNFGDIQRLRSALRTESRIILLGLLLPVGWHLTLIAATSASESVRTELCRNALDDRLICADARVRIEIGVGDQMPGKLGLLRSFQRYRSRPEAIVVVSSDAPEFVRLLFGVLIVVRNA